MQAKILSRLAGLMLAMLLIPGCLIISEEHHHNDDGHCYTECYEHQVCQPYCDAYSCWDDCWMQTSCDTVCDGSAPDDDYFNEPAYCFSDHDCNEGRICVSGSCKAADTDDRGQGGLCQACQSRQDCGEQDALCLQINYDESTGFAETVCGRACELDSECPSGFECLKVSDDDSLSPQCVPEQDSGGLRTCDAGDDLECVGASDCAVGESCVNNTCQGPSNAECNADSDCAGGQKCSGYQCVDQCVAGDCGDGEMCIDGECVRETISCVFNADCPDDARCVDGQCAATCSESDDCGANERCRQGVCEYIECYQTSDCSAGQVCVEASCEQGCQQDSDCGFGFICSGFNFCQPDPDVECRSSAECSSDQACNDAGECVSSCACDDQCGTGQICNENSGICEDEGSSDADGIQC